MRRLFKSIEEERRQRLVGRHEPDYFAWILWERALILCDEPTRKCLEEAYIKASKINYFHAGLSSDVYFAHPLRVASLSFLYTQNIHAAVVGLFHNIIEVGGCNLLLNSYDLPPTVISQLISLNVERKHQWDADYNLQYFYHLQEGPRSAVIVKVFDKLDNLFTLGVNPDSEVRGKYLEHFTEYILPIIRCHTPDLASFAETLIADTQRIGFIDELEQPK